MKAVLAAAIVVSLMIGVVAIAILVLANLPVSVMDVKNDQLQIRHYYDHRSNAAVVDYYAELQNGQPTGVLYAVELRPVPTESRSQIIQFSETGATDSNPGTLVRTIPRQSREYQLYHSMFVEVQNKHRTQKRWERVVF